MVIKEKIHAYFVLLKVEYCSMKARKD